MTDLVARRAVEQGEPAEGVPPPRPPMPRAATDPAGAPAGVELHRLLALARLTPPQALGIAADVLAEAAGWAEPGSPVGVGPVVVGVDGLVRIGHDADGRAEHAAATGGEPGPPLAGVLADVARSARRTRGGEPVPDPLLAELDRAAADLPVAGVPAVAERLRAAAAATDRGAVSAELAALAQAVRGVARGPRGAGAAAGPRAAARAALPRAAPGGRRRTGLRRLGAWVLSVLVVGGIVLLEVATLRDHIAADVRQLLDAGRSGSAPSSAPPPDGRPVPAFAPPVAGPVTAVDLRPLAPCAGGAPCSLRVLVRLAPHAGQQVVTWSYRVVDRCTGATSAVPGGSVAVPPDGDRAVAVGVVPLPALRSVALVAVTDLPAAAASPPVVLGSCRPGP